MRILIVLLLLIGLAGGEVSSRPVTPSEKAHEKKVHLSVSSRSGTRTVRMVWNAARERALRYYVMLLAYPPRLMCAAGEEVIPATAAAATQELLVDPGPHCPTGRGTASRR